jgi:hypothetical protein
MTLRNWWGAQFIGSDSGGGQFEQVVLAAGGGRRVLAQWIRGSYCGGHSGDQRRVTKAYGDAVEILRHVAQGRKAAGRRRMRIADFKRCW